jgi:NAD(P)-dependent dehydrogenase (short-subunit alcohol dehydrogenase family)
VPAALPRVTSAGPLESRTALGRIGQPQDIALAPVFLTSSDAAWITGESLLSRLGSVTGCDRLLRPSDQQGP